MKLEKHIFYVQYSKSTFCATGAGEIAVARSFKFKRTFIRFFINFMDSEFEKVFLTNFSWL